jgi:hypothetical protein
LAASLLGDRGKVSSAFFSSLEAFLKDLTLDKNFLSITSVLPVCER